MVDRLEFSCNLYYSANAMQCVSGVLHDVLALVTLLQNFADKFHDFSHDKDLETVFDMHS